MQHPKRSLGELALAVERPQNPALLRGGDYIYQDPETGQMLRAVEYTDPETGEPKLRLLKASFNY